MWGSLSGKAAAAAGVAVLRWNTHSESQGYGSEMGFRLSCGSPGGGSWEQPCVGNSSWKKDKYCRPSSLLYHSGEVVSLPQLPGALLDKSTGVRITALHRDPV